jgi:hypothetical protein
VVKIPHQLLAHFNVLRTRERVREWVGPEKVVRRQILTSLSEQRSSSWLAVSESSIQALTTTSWHVRESLRADLLDDDDRRFRDTGEPA